MLDDYRIKPLSKQDNIIIINEFNINWANQFFATLSLIKKALNKWHDLKYFHLISGQDYSIRNNSEFDTYFEQHKDNVFMSVTTSPYLNYRYDIFNPIDIINTRNCKGIINFLQMPYFSFSKSFLISVFDLENQFHTKFIKGVIGGL